MRAYSVDDVERIRTQSLVRDWTKAAFLDASQGAALDGELRTNLRRTNVALRVVLALFTTILIQATLGLVFVSTRIKDVTPVTTTLIVAAIVCAVAAEWLVQSLRVYRYGVEEAFAVSSVLLFSFAIMYVLVEGWREPIQQVFRSGLIVGAVGGFVLYHRYGFLYAAIAGLASAAAVPFQFDLTTAGQRIIGVSVLAVAFGLARNRGLRYVGDFRADEYATFGAGAWGGAYLLLNLELFDLGLRWTGIPAVPAPFYWSTYAAIWVMPAAGLFLAIRNRDRSLLGANILMALLTIAANKSYLGWQRYTWDPMFLGALLMGIAIAVRRWLSAGPGGERGGFTRLQLAEADRDIVRTIATASVTFQAPAAPSAGRESSGFDGGRSGGGGAGSGF